MKRKMTSKEALKKLSYVPIFEDNNCNTIADIDCYVYSSCVYICAYIGDLCEIYDSEVNIIKKDLDQLEKLKKENQELKEQINRYNKVIEDIKNLPSYIGIGFKNMFDNCKELTPLTDMKEKK